MKITVIGQIQNGKTGLGKALNDLISYSREYLGNSNVQEVDVTDNKKIFNHVRAILNSDADVFYFTPAGSAFGNLRDLLLLFFIHLKRRRVVLHFHNSNYGNVTRTWLRRKLNALALKRVAKIIVLGDKQKQMFSHLAVPENKFSVVRNGIDSELFLTDEELALKRQSKITNIVYFSNMIVEKGYLQVLDLAEHLSDNPNYHFYFSGKFFDQTLAEEFHKKNANISNVTYIPGVYGMEKRELLKQMHYFILPSTYKDETLPISMLEAMAMCNFVIVSDVGVVSEVVDPQNSLLLDMKKDNQALILKTLAQRFDLITFDSQTLKQRYRNQEIQKELLEKIIEEN